MQLTATIYTTNTSRFVQKALPAIYKVIATAKGVEVADFEVKEIKLPNLVPTKSSGLATRIDFDWMGAIYPTDNKVLCLHISKAERTRLKLRHPDGGNIGGSFNRDANGKAFEFFIVGDTQKDFTQKFLHELSHCFNYWTQKKADDLTHHYDYELHNLEAIYYTYDFTQVNTLTKTKNLLEAAVAALKATLAKKKPNTLLHPVAKYKDYISQAYSAPNKVWYPLTGHHLGTDYACPVGTPVVAPWNGEVIVSGKSPALGNFCHYKYTFDGVTYIARFLHLSNVPVRATYKRGELIELSGKSGNITGPHLHIDIFYNEVRLDIINSKNFKNLTINPQTHYAN